MTPAREQYLQVRREYPDAILFFQLGDFYETFDDDAQVVAQLCDVALTSREMGKGGRIPLAGVPVHAAEPYIAKLLTAGHRVAICQQIGPAETIGGRQVFDRQVTRVVTPGTVLEPGLLNAKANNYLAAVAREGDAAGLAYADISTGEFRCAQLALGELVGELRRLDPAEVLLPREAELLAGYPLAGAEGALVTEIEPWWFEREGAEQTLRDQFEVASLDGFGCAGLPLAVQAAGALLRYLQRTQRGLVAQIAGLATYAPGHYMTLDPQTRRNLELQQSSRAGTHKGSLLACLDLTRTAMGGRLLRQWLSQPLLERAPLEARLDRVEAFHADPVRRAAVVAALARVGDLERLVNRVRAGQAGPRDLAALRRSLEAIPAVQDALPAAGPLGALAEGLKPCAELAGAVAAALVDEPPATLGAGDLVRPGHHPEIDRIVAASRDAKGYIAALEAQERERTGIKSLKVGYNKVFGYYLEISNAYREQVPDDYIRKQTLVGAERYITPALKEYEVLVFTAADQIAELAAEVFRGLCQQVVEAAPDLLASARAVATLDVVAALAEVAGRWGYVRPQLSEGESLEIVGGRHPVVEQALGPGVFVPNDTYLNCADAQIVVLTGPNMAGKSTYLRQVALIVLLAQIGSFVPADSATIGLVDRIFTRVGAQDDLATGQSTFMVEMVETANILHHATRRSLLVLDEIGRGTSTYDGLAIAKAVIEYLHNDPRLGARTLFATHYHELTELAMTLPRVRNFNVAVSEQGDQVVFLHRIVPGGADRSYGIHVAQLAGLPRAVVRRAQDILTELERKGLARPRPRRSAAPPPDEQMALFQAPPPLIEELANTDVDSLTPLEAMTRLYELRKKARDSIG